MRVALSGLLLLALASFPLNTISAQGGSPPRTRSVHGTVTDRRGNTLPGAVVQIENDRTLAVASSITKRDGTYQFSQLDTDQDFTLRAHYRKLWSKPKALSRFNESRSPEVNLEIPTE